MARTKGAKDKSPRVRRSKSGAPIGGTGMRPSRAAQRAMDQAEADTAKAEGGENAVSSTAVKEAMAKIERAEAQIKRLKEQHKADIQPFHEDIKEAKHRAKNRGVPMQPFGLVLKQRRLEKDLDPAILELADEFIRPALKFDTTPLGAAATKDKETKHALDEDEARRARVAENEKALREGLKPLEAAASKDEEEMRRAAVAVREENIAPIDPPQAPDAHAAE
jgi:hypothetical protein